MAAKLQGKVAVVTGASKGIGAEIARELARHGAAVVVNYSSSRADAEKVVKDITGAGGRAVSVQANVGVSADIARLFAETKKAYGRLDVLVNNAGVYEFQPLEGVTEGHFRKIFDLNVLGLLLTTQEAVKQMGPGGGSIINISSVVSTITPPQSVVYSSSKAAVDAITRTLAKELAGRKIRVNSVNPGLVETEGVKSAGFSEGEFRAGFEAQSPLGRIGQPGDIAPAVAFLASEDSGWVTGEALYIGGGVR